MRDSSVDEIIRAIHEGSYKKNARVVKGMIFFSRDAIAEYFKISKSSFLSLVSKGYSEEEAVDILVSKKGSKAYERSSVNLFKKNGENFHYIVNGTGFWKLLDIAESSNTCYSLFLEMINRGYSIEEAIVQANTDEAYKLYRLFKLECVKRGIPLKKARYFLVRGMLMEDVIKSNFKLTYCALLGKKYKSLSDIGKEYNIVGASLSKKVANNVHISEAILNITGRKLLK